MPARILCFPGFCVSHLPLEVSCSLPTFRWTLSHHDDEAAFLHLFSEKVRMPGSCRGKELCDHFSQESGHRLHHQPFSYFECLIVAPPGTSTCFVTMSHREIGFVEFPVTWIERRKNRKGPSVLHPLIKEPHGGRERRSWK